jgi:hypothetical protein
MVKMFEIREVREVDSPGYRFFLKEHWPYCGEMNAIFLIDQSQRYRAQKWCRTRFGDQANRESSGQLFYNTKRSWVNVHTFFRFRNENDAFEFKMTWG